ncbi:MAG: hypothetical protein J3K34DRAFT_436404 [Monoraphidium minutum]|nr:MAG: hypothetical protein J3K34DRAFT_436404 [Monoraphidium minutum]
MGQLEDAQDAAKDAKQALQETVPPSFVDDAKEMASKAGEVVDQGVVEASKAVRSSLAWLFARGQEGLEAGSGALESSKAQVSEVAGVLNEHQERAFSALKSGIEYVAVHPEISYPLGAAAAVAAVPPLRRLLYRVTIGRFRSPETVVAGAEQRLGTLGARIEDYGKEAQKLQARALSAHEEMSRGYSKLKAARSELQRLQAAVGKTERATSSVLDDLRGVGRGVAKATELRAEAAQKLAAVKQQHALLRKEIKWIARLDV